MDFIIIFQIEKMVHSVLNAQHKYSREGGIFEKPSSNSLRANVLITSLKNMMEPLGNPGLGFCNILLQITVEELRELKGSLDNAISVALP